MQNWKLSFPFPQLKKNHESHKEKKKIKNDLHFKSSDSFPPNIYLFKVSNKNTRKRCEICSKLTIKTPERR